MPDGRIQLTAVRPKAGQHTLHMWMRRFALTCLDAAFPARCRQCEQLYTREDPDPQAGDNEKQDSRTYGALMADHLCRQCTQSHTMIQSPLCSKCGLPFKTRHGVDHPCPDCQDRSFAFDAARAAGLLDKTMRTLIHQYKYQGRTELAQPMGILLWETLHRFYGFDDIDLILPVPLHWFRQYRRGFNQSALLVRHWGKLAELRGMALCASLFEDDVLVRRKHTTSQTGLGKARRKANLMKAFEVRNPTAVRAKRILLIDDVLTTGATADACARVLKQSGAQSVKVLTVARAA